MAKQNWSKLGNAENKKRPRKLHGKSRTPSGLERKTDEKEKHTRSTQTQGVRIPGQHVTLRLQQTLLIGHHIGKGPGKALWECEPLSICSFTVQAVGGSW